MDEKQCKCCGEAFVPKSHLQLYCGADCKAAYAAGPKVEAPVALEAPPAPEPTQGDDALGQIAGMLRGIDDKLSGLTERVDELEKTPQAPPLTVEMDPEAILKGMDLNLDEIRQVTRTYDPRKAYPDQFHEGDVVTLKPDSEKLRLYREGSMDEKGTCTLSDEVRGVVTMVGHLTKGGQTKYQVKFIGVGSDGITGDELLLVRAA
jgi:hypothetical protein